jgi:beta-glucanase (GH16 family)
MLVATVLSGAMLCGGCGVGQVSTASEPAAAPPAISTAAAQNGAVIVRLESVTPGAAIHYTLDNSSPTASSQVYEAPFLVASNLTVKAIAMVAGNAPSSVMTRTFTSNIPSGTQVWSDDFTYPAAGGGQPDPQVWTYDTGNGGFGNREQETYCAWGSDAAPCSTANPSASVGIDGNLHIVARQVAPGTYTSARLKSQGRLSFLYGRIEARLKLPELQGMWPAFWLLGNNIATVNWPACGELDVMEHIDGNNPQNKGHDWVQASVHGTGLDGGTPFTAPGFSAADWHTYGMIWSKGKVEYYIDDPAKPYETFTASTMTGAWPFDDGPQFILLNLAVGGSWPGNVDATTVFPAEMLVDYVRIYTN